MSALGQKQKIRACPLHVCFTPKPGRSRAQVEMSEKGHKQTFAVRLGRSYDENS